MAVGVNRGAEATGPSPAVHCGGPLPRWAVPAGGLAGAALLLQCALRPLPQTRTALGQVTLPFSLQPNICPHFLPTCPLLRLPHLLPLIASFVYNECLVLVVLTACFRRGLV